MGFEFRMQFLQVAGRLEFDRAILAVGRAPPDQGAGGGVAAADVDVAVELRHHGPGEFAAQELDLLAADQVLGEPCIRHKEIAGETYAGRITYRFAVR